MASVTHELAFKSVSIRVLTLSSTFTFVVCPVSFVPTTSVIATSEDYLSTTMFESIFESASVDISTQGPQRSLTIHLPISEVTLVDVTVLEL